MLLPVAAVALLFGMGEAASAHYYLRFPWGQGKGATVTQAYNGGTHINEDSYALDLDVEGAGTLGDITAAGYGEVVSRQTGRTCDGINYGNFVTVKIVYPQGQVRYALYGHLSSVSVSIGDKILQGQKLGVEGNSGYTWDCGPHLHFRITETQGCQTKDNCAVEPEPMSGQGTADGESAWAVGATPTSDNTAAQEADIAALFKYGASGARIHTWMEDGAAFGFYDADGWWRVDSGFNLSNVGDRMVMGDYDGDGLKDVAVFFDYGGCQATIFVWLARPLNATQTLRFSYQFNGGAGWWSRGGYCLGQVAGRMVSGDFTGDGKADIAAFYDYLNGSGRIHVWTSTGSGFTGYDVNGWWSTTGDIPVSEVADRFVAGDFTGDGKTDVAALYHWASTGALFRVWRSTGSSFVDTGNWWSVGSGYDLTKVGDRLVAGNFDGVGKDDVATFFQYPNAEARIHVWLSSGSSFTGYSPVGWWGYGISGYILDQVDGRMVSADFGSMGGGADGKADIATFYDYGSGQARIHVWRSTGSIFAGYDSDGWWSVGSGYPLSGVAGRMVAGPFDGR